MHTRACGVLAVLAVPAVVVPAVLRVAFNRHLFKIAFPPSYIADYLKRQVFPATHSTRPSILELLALTCTFSKASYSRTIERYKTSLVKATAEARESYPAFLNQDWRELG